MARTASIALGGFYPTLPHLIPRIAALIEPHLGRGDITFVDPCAGEGDAVLGLMKALLKNLDECSPSLYACEMEATRAEKLSVAAREVSYRLSQNLVHGDAFRLTFNRGSNDGASVLFLNPPYDLDRVHGRLEHKFLDRFTSSLMEGGILLFLVPFYSLKASAEFLAQEYTDVRCFKYPEGDFEVFKQVVLFARKCSPKFEPEQAIVQRVNAWAQDSSGLPELPNITSKPLCEIPEARQYHGGLSEWAIRPVDVTSLTKKIRPWIQTTRSGVATSVHGVLPDLPIQELLLRKYPVATPPRPAHIAAGIASGIFNGSRVKPSNPKAKLPALLVKGVFDKEYRTVEEKTNKDGEVKGLVQVQQPKLVVTVLDLTTHKYHTLKSGDTTDAPEIEELTVTGLLRHYGDSLMAVMEQQCPILYDPRKDGDSIPLAPTHRKLFTAQGHASKAIVKLLGGPTATKKERYRKAAILLGEIGSGKSTVALAVANTVGSKRPLILCPPHLLTSWRNEVAACLPEAEVRVLDSITALEDLAKDTSDRTIVSVLSRETAKLSHGWEGVGAVCPKCGGPTPPVDLAKRRSHCENRSLHGSGPISQAVLKLGHQLMRYAPHDTTINWLLKSQFDNKRRAFYKKKHEDKPLNFPGFSKSYFDAVLPALFELCSHDFARASKAIAWILLCLSDNDRILQVARMFLDKEGYREREFGRHLLLMLPPNDPIQLATAEEYRSLDRTEWSPWGHFRKLVDDAVNGESYVNVASIQVSWQSGVLALTDMKAKSIEAACSALNILAHVSNLKWSDYCDEFLFQATPEPRRTALAQHILNRYPELFDFLVLDEAHEYQNDDSAQGRSAHRLTGLGVPTILMTGTIMNGYAESLFSNMWAISPDFRREFSRDQKQRFIDRYGYRKRIIEDRDGEGKVVEFGSMSDRVTRSERIIGDAPGVLPLFLLRHLLPLAVTLHKADLALDLPICKQERHLIEPGPELKSRYEVLQRMLVEKIKKDQFDPELAGKLFGQLAELPSYLDRATSDTGNTEEGVYEIRYPESVGAALVAAQEPFSASTLLPKEQWLLDMVEKELAEGRNVMVFTWHVNLLPRLSNLISKAIGQKVPILYANKVPTAKRQDWIDREIVRKDVRVMVTNPVAIQTGLNNLVHFATELWMENPACNPITYRQGIGRVDRIGQTIETRIYSPLYAGTLQVQLYDLLLKKVAVSVSTDGLDPESALLAAGVGEDEYLTGLSIGKQLWAMLSDGVVNEERGIVYKPARKSAPNDAVALLSMLEER